MEEFASTKQQLSHGGVSNSKGIAKANPVPRGFAAFDTDVYASASIAQLVRA